MEKTAASMVTGKCRASYANVWEPRKMEGSESARYSLTLLIPKADKLTRAKIDRCIQAAAEDGVNKVWGGKRPANLPTPIYDGDGLRPNGEKFGPECAGHWVMSAWSKFAPGIIDANKEAIIDKTEFYSGCYCRASLTFYGYSRAGKRGIGCGLNNLQKLADGEPLGGKRRAEDDFDDAFEDDDIDDLLY